MPESLSSAMDHPQAYRSSSPLRVVIVEDEPACTEDLTDLIAGLPLPIRLEGDADTLEAGVELVRRVRPDLVFLDVEIRDRKGFELLNAFPEPEFDVIFTTGYSQYALQAIKVAALDFLLKPVDRDELLTALLRKETRDLNLRQKMETLRINMQKDQLKRIAIPTLNGLEFMEVDQILYCQAEDNYTNVHLRSGPACLVSKTLKKLEELLENRNFFRTNRSTLLNLDYLKSYSRGKTAYVTLDTGQQFSVSPNRKDAFLQRINLL